MAGKVFTLYVTVVSWHDGDTFYGVIDQGFRDYKGRLDRPVRNRCALIDAPELLVNKLPNQAGLDALAYAQTLAPLGTYACHSYRPTALAEDEDTFGRPLLDLVLPDGQTFSAAMLAAGHAVPYRH